ncbi:MAG: cache domain-containing protein, partial [bacterium]
MRIVPLKTKLVSLLIVGGIFLCLLVGFTTYFYLNSTLQNENQKQVESLNIEQGHELFQIFENNALFAKMLGTRTRVTEYLLDRTEPRREELLNIFLDYAQTDSEILSLYLLDETGKTLISTDPSFVGGNYSFREYFKQSIMGIPHVDMLLGKTSNELGYYFSHPVLNKDKKVIGVFVSKISGNKINTALSFSELRKNSKIMLTDAFGVIISNTMPDRFLKSLGQLTAKEEAIINSSQKFLNKNSALLNELLRTMTSMQTMRQDVIQKINQQTGFLQEILSDPYAKKSELKIQSEYQLDVLKSQHKMIFDLQEQLHELKILSLQH